MSASLIGRTLGKYKIVELLGQGGMATVYIGYQQAVDRRVAIKVLPPHPGLDDQFIDRFQIEARTIARLQHPHILPLYDYGSEDDILYLAMAYIEGGTLDDRIARGPMTLRSAEKTLREVASAMDYAHRQGVIHRDIKPGNILIDREGHALLADFGIAKIADSANLTGTGVVGTPAYMAPEQAQGGVVDHRADIYALGVVVYQMITGRQPFTGDTPMQVLLKVMQEPAPDILDMTDGLPPALSEVMHTVLAKDPQERYQSAVEFAEAFSRAIHASDDSLVAARKEFPLRSASESSGGTTIPKASPFSAKPGENQTIIVQQSTNPLLLLGGFAIMAVAIVAVVILVIGSQGRGDDDNAAATQSAVALVGTQTAAAAAALPTETESPTTTPAPTSVPVQTFGRLSFSNIGGLGDAMSMQVQGLQPVAAGQVYAAWLVNTADDSRLRIGELAVDPLGNGALSFTDSEGRLLPALFNAVFISLETRGSIGDAPSDTIRYSASIPLEVSALLQEMLVASPDGLNGGSLLDGARAEARVAAQHSGLAASATNVGGMHTHAEHTVNILRGETVDYTGNGRGENPGRGVGVFFFLDRIDDLLNIATTAPGASRLLQSDAEFIRVCLENTRQRAERVIELELELLAAQDVAAVSQQAEESTAVANVLQSGVDLNENNIIEAFEGECGLDQISTFGILVASMEIVAGLPAAGD